MSHSRFDLPTVTVFNASSATPPVTDLSYATAIEQAVEIDEIDTDLYRSRQLWTPLGARGVFGGQVVAQALRAATKTVGVGFSVHSLHSYFILPGNNQIPILFQVARLRDGKSYVTRAVNAKQKGRVIFTLTCSFAVMSEDISLNHQYSMPKVADPETLPNDEERINSYLNHPDLDIPPKYREYLLKRIDEQSPMDYRNCYVPDLKHLDKPLASSIQHQWFKTRGTLNDDDTLHQCVVAYASDSSLIGTVPRANGLSRAQIGMMASLDHAIWFHAPFRADEWLLYEMEAPRSNNGRGMALGRIFRRDGTLVVSVAQEGLIRLSEREREKRKRAMQNEQSVQSKL